MTVTFLNDKKTFLAKSDKSKKGSVDERLLPLINLINSKDHYYTTSSCSGRIYLWQGSGKKNETEWLKVSHELIRDDFFECGQMGLVWLRMEGAILHIACKDMDSANKLLEAVKMVCKKSGLLSASNKIIVEIRSSEFVEMPLYLDGKLLFSGELSWLMDLLNQKLKQTWERMRKVEGNITFL